MCLQHQLCDWSAAIDWHRLHLMQVNLVARSRLCFWKIHGAKVVILLETWVNQCTNRQDLASLSHQRRHIDVTTGSSWLPSFQAMFSRFDTTGSGVMEDGGLVYQYITVWKKVPLVGAAQDDRQIFLFCHAQKVNKKLQLSRNSTHPFPSHLSHRSPGRRSNFDKSSAGRWGRNITNQGDKLEISFVGSLLA